MGRQVMLVIRPVSLATIISKLLEHYILSCISPFVANHRQSVWLQATTWHWHLHIFTQIDCIVLCNKGTPVF